MRSADRVSGFSERLKLWLPTLAFAAAAAALLGGLGKDPTLLPSPLLGKPLPAFSLSSLQRPERRVTPDELAGPLLLNVWASWCAACRDEHALLLEMAERGVAVVGLNYKDRRDDALAWLERFGNPYRVSLFDPDGALGLDLGVYGVPESYWLDRDGIIEAKHVGALGDAVWRERHEALAGLPPPQAKR